jgi:hypothetical protein
MASPRVIISPDGKNNVIQIDDIQTLCIKCGKKLIVGERVHFCHAGKNIFCIDDECKLKNCSFGYFQKEHQDFIGTLQARLN